MVKVDLATDPADGTPVPDCPRPATPQVPTAPASQFLADQPAHLARVPFRDRDRAHLFRGPGRTARQGAPQNRGPDGEGETARTPKTEGTREAQGGTPSWRNPPPPGTRSVATPGRACAHHDRRPTPGEPHGPSLRRSPGQCHASLRLRRRSHRPKQLRSRPGLPRPDRVRSPSAPNGIGPPTSPIPSSSRKPKWPVRPHRPCLGSRLEKGFGGYHCWDASVKQVLATATLTRPPPTNFPRAFWSASTSRRSSARPLEQSLPPFDPMHRFPGTDSATASPQTQTRISKP